MTWNLQTPIPTDDALVLITSGRSCAMYEDGELESLGDPIHYRSNQVDLESPAVRYLLRLAGVTLVEDVPRALIVDDGAPHGPVRRLRLADVEAVRQRLAQAVLLRADAKKALAEADRLEGRR